jgi:endonuclease/exonuclease/phosphatase family metal-dependent hydrolase
LTAKPTPLLLPQNRERLPTSFPRRNRRFDWITVSADFRFRDYRTLPNVLSDHRAVVATLELARHPEKAKHSPFAVPNWAPRADL